MKISNRCFELLYSHGKRLDCCKSNNMQLQQITPLSFKIKSFAFLFFFSIPLLIVGGVARLIERRCCCIKKNHGVPIQGLGFNDQNPHPNNNITFRLFIEKLDQSNPNNALPLSTQHENNLSNKLFLNNDIFKKITSYLDCEGKGTALLVNKQCGINVIAQLKSDLSSIALVNKFISTLTDYPDSSIVDELKEECEKSINISKNLTELSEIYTHFSKLIISIASILNKLPSEVRLRCLGVNCSNKSDIDKLFLFSFIECSQSIKKLINNYPNEASIVFKKLLFRQNTLKNVDYYKMTKLYLTQNNLKLALELSKKIVVSRDNYAAFYNSLSAKTKLLTDIATAYYKRGNLRKFIEIIEDETSCFSRGDKDKFYPKIAEDYYAKGNTKRAVEIAKKISDVNKKDKLLNDLYTRIAKK